LHERHRGRPDAAGRRDRFRLDRLPRFAQSVAGRLVSAGHRRGRHVPAVPARFRGDHLRSGGGPAGCVGPGRDHHDAGGDDGTPDGRRPDRAAGVRRASAHRPCTEAPASAGPHYQHSADPATPSVDPAYANPRNEVWLDFTTDEAGAAAVASEVRWSFPPGAAARSLIIHAEQTRTGAGVAGTAGPRVACLTLPAR
jgi:hypothetical protein